MRIVNKFGRIQNSRKLKRHDFAPSNQVRLFLAPIMINEPFSVELMLTPV